MNRLFIALSVSSHIKDSLTSELEALSHFSDILKAVSPHQMHITLKFIGKADPKKTEEIMKLLPPALKGHAPISYEAAGLGAFPSLKKASVFWCGLSADMEALSSLHHDVESAMEEAGLERENRAFHPHITLARLRKGRKLPPRLISYFQERESSSFGQGRFDTVILYKSDLTPSGPRYTALLTIKLEQ